MTPSILSRICLGCALSASLLTSSAAAEVRVLDLVAEPTQWGPQPKTTFKGGGTWHVEPRIKPTLPFAVKLESIQPDASDATRSIVEFTIRNTGQRSFALPVGRNHRLIDPSRRGLRQLWIFLQDPNKPEDNRKLASATFSNTNKPSSIAAMAPGDAWRIRFPIRLAELEELKRSERASTVDLRVGLTLWEYEVDPAGLVLQSPFPEAMSDNSISVTLKAP